MVELSTRRGSFARRSALAVGAVWSRTCVLAGCVCILGAACERPTAESPSVEAAAELPLQPVTRFPDDFQWRQRVTARWEHSSRAFDAVVTKDGDQLRLLGLDPIGRPGFIFTLQGGQVRVENRTGQQLPFDPGYILLDVQRAFYPWIERPTQDGWHSRAVGAHYVAEHWREGRLRQRRFHPDSSSAPDVVITYDEYGKGLSIPRRVELVHRIRGYSLVIETMDQQTFTP